jgi:hypothetical protein
MTHLMTDLSEQMSVAKSETVIFYLYEAYGFCVKMALRTIVGNLLESKLLLLPRHKLEITQKNDTFVARSQRKNVRFKNCNRHWLPT